MDYRQLGRTGVKVSAIGFGGGAVGGILVKGARRERIDAVARAIEAGITYFDTARAYGNGVSETNLGEALAELKADVVVGTKVDLQPDELADIEGSVIRSVEGSLERLRREQVDLIQLHNPVAPERRLKRGWLAPEDVEAVLSAFAKLQAQGKARFFGINGVGDTATLHKLIATGRADTIQAIYNLLNPTAGHATPAGYPYQDYRQLIDLAAEEKMGVIAIRVLAGGALTGVTIKHPNSAPRVSPIGTAATYAEDVAVAKRFNFLVDEGIVESPVEAAIRFVLTKPEVSTVMVGLANMAQLEEAITFANRGPLSQETVARLDSVWNKLGNA